MMIYSAFITTIVFILTKSNANDVFKWYYANVNTGSDTCVQWQEPSDVVGTWADNKLCSSVDFRVTWSYAGAIADMACTQIYEPSEPGHTAWTDNFLCVPPESPLQFSWSFAGPMDGLDCVQIVEPSDEHAWHDNYLCYEFCDELFRWSHAGRITGENCVHIYEGSDVGGTWLDNYLCSYYDWKIRWSSAGAISGMRCEQVTEPSEPGHTTWNDNYICVPHDSPLYFKWSYAGPVENSLGCTRFIEPADPHTWADNYLCYRLGSAFASAHSILAQLGLDTFVGSGANEDTTHTTSKFTYALYVIGVLVVINIVWLSVSCCKRGQNNKNHHKVVSIQSESDVENEILVE